MTPLETSGTGADRNTTTRYNTRQHHSVVTGPFIMSALNKLPPHVARELRRHISPPPLKRNPLPNEQNSSSLRWVVGGCLALVGTAASFPLIATWWISLNDRPEALTANQVRRGAFNNSGSRDVGRDPDYDFEKGEHKLKSGYAAMMQEDSQVSNIFLAVDSKILDKHAKEIEELAKGKTPKKD